LGSAGAKAVHIMLMKLTVGRAKVRPTELLIIGKLKYNVTNYEYYLKFYINRHKKLQNVERKLKKIAEITSTAKMHLFISNDHQKKVRLCQNYISFLHKIRKTILIL